MTLEAAVLAPSVILILGAIIAFGRLGMADNTIDQVAHDAARVASIELNAETAQSKATQVAQATLAAQGISCSNLTVSVDPAGFTTPVGTAGTVNVAISCTVPLADQALPFLPGSKTLTATASRAIDTYRERA